MASLSSLTTSESNPPAVIPSHSSVMTGYSKQPTGKNQAEEEDIKKGNNSSNPWGKGSYSDLITMALMSSPERKMTLDEIYRWIAMNIPYFRNKGDEISSSGWKVLELAVGRLLLICTRLANTEKINSDFICVFFTQLQIRIASLSVSKLK